MKNKIYLICVFIAFFFNAPIFSQRSFYVSTNGSAASSGSKDNPWSLDFALQNAQKEGKISGGDTINILGGSYYGLFESVLGFATGAPVIVKNYQNDKVVLQNPESIASGNILTIKGINCWYMGFEITSNPSSRIDAGTSEINGINLFGKNVKLINLSVHDVNGTGIGSWLANNSVIYGCFIYNNGRENASNPSGPGIYLQNDNINEPTTIEQNYIFNNFGSNIQAKAVNLANGKVSGVHITRNTLFNASGYVSKNAVKSYNLYVGSEVYDYNPATDIFINNNIFYNGSEAEASYYVQSLELKPGFYKSKNIVLGLGQKDSSVFFDRNIVMGSSYVGELSLRTVIPVLQVTNNQFYGKTKDESSKLIGIDISITDGQSKKDILGNNWNNNAYFSIFKKPFVYLQNGTHHTAYNLTEFSKVFEVDGNSTYSNVLPKDTVIVRGNKYDNKIYYINLINYSKKLTATVNLAAYNLNNKYYKLYDIQNLDGNPVSQGKILSNNLSITLNNNIAIPLKGSSLNPIHTNELNTYLLQIVEEPVENLNAPYNLTVFKNSEKTAILEWTNLNEHLQLNTSIQVKNNDTWQSIGETRSNRFNLAGLDNYFGKYIRVVSKVNNIDLSSNAVYVNAIFYVSDNATQGSNGSLANPLLLSEALSNLNNKINAGDTVRILAGTYLAPFETQTLFGTYEKPIVFTNYNDGKVVIDGKLSNSQNNVFTIGKFTANTEFNNLTVTNSSDTRIFNSSAEASRVANSGIYIQGESVKLNNMIVKNIIGNGIYVEHNAKDLQLNNCFIYYNGYTVSNAPNGNGIAFNNSNIEYSSSIRNSYIFSNFRHNVYIYGQTNRSNLNNLFVLNNTIFNSGNVLANNITRRQNLYMAGANNNFPLSNVYVNNNLIVRDTTDGAGGEKPHNLRQNISIGTNGVSDSLIDFNNNYIIGGSIYGALSLAGQLNTFNHSNNIYYAYNDLNNSIFDGNYSHNNGVFDNNSYYTTHNTAFLGSNFNNWKAANPIDANSTFSQSTPNDTMFISKDAYNKEAYFVNITNHFANSSLKIRFPAKDNKAAVLRDVQNMDGLPIIVKIENDSINIPLTLSNVELPAGNTSSIPRHTKAIHTFQVSYQYFVSECNTTNTTVNSPLNGTVYQWQIWDGKRFVDLTDGPNYANAKSKSLTLNNILSPVTIVKCMVDNVFSDPVYVQIGNYWTGASNSKWHNPLNWSCTQVPDKNTNVVLNEGDMVEIDGRADCKTLTLNEGATVSIKNNQVLTIHN
ncbi:right-handed parallel beta-helix repeat-containing protein [Polluticaenibacter yanchengensis]|uniref:DUF1565 domain-containing protein n=1 Tax=Polluticaenibacter yanchengensis TaxID=3014562 RepID=A0ABT4UIY2_9BACT|nr:hypothetical protein [Chitinophagaceae bacterium LY-5]